MLMIATSYRVNEDKRAFKSEYIISQSVMMACKRVGYDGVAYFSRRVSDKAFAYCAIDLALFVNFDGEYSSLIKHIKMDDPLNYFVFKQLLPSLKYKEYDLRTANNPLITNIGNYDRQYPYRETEFFEFDKFLFASWEKRSSGKGKNEPPGMLTFFQPRTSYAASPSDFLYCTGLIPPNDSFIRSSLYQRI